MQIFKTPNINFFRWRGPALGVSTLVILVGVYTVWSGGGLPLGIDFSGGTAVVVRFAEPTPEEAVRTALVDVPGEKVVQQYGDPTANEVLIRLPQIAEETGASLEQGSNAVVEAISAAGLAEFEVQSTDIVGPVIGRELQQKGIYATLCGFDSASPLARSPPCFTTSS